MKTKNFLMENKSKIGFYTLIILTIVTFVFLINSCDVFAIPQEVNTQAQFDKSFNHLAKLIKQITSFMVGFSVVSGFATMIYHFTRLGACGSNPQARAKVLQDMLTTGICIALLGSFNLILYFIVSMMKIMN